MTDFHTWEVLGTSCHIWSIWELWRCPDGVHLRLCIRGHSSISLSLHTERSPYAVSLSGHYLPALDLCIVYLQIVKLCRVNTSKIVVAQVLHFYYSKGKWMALHKKSCQIKSGVVGHFERIISKRSICKQGRAVKFHQPEYKISCAQRANFFFSGVEIPCSGIEICGEWPLKLLLNEFPITCRHWLSYV